MVSNHLARIQKITKNTNPLFIRLIETSNRINYHQQNELAKLEAGIAEQKFYFKVIQYASIVALLLLVIYFARFVSLQIHDMAEHIEDQKDKALAATESKSIFLANMSHEIRTPLNAITGFIKLLKEQENDPNKINYLKTIDNSSQSLLGIINDILDFSKIESNKIEFDFIDFDPRDSFNSVADLFKAKCSEKNILLEVIINHEMPPALYSDPLRIKQVISNLLSNAVKFSTPGKTIRLEINYDRKYDELNVSVIDQGVGISYEKQQKIFDAFSQAESNTTRQYGGTGLGLAISSLLVQFLGGHLKVDSEPNKGSKFFFTIPVTEGKPIKKASGAIVNNPEIKGKLLLVEDNKTNQMLMGAILKKMNLEFDLAEDGNEAVEAFQDNRYDLILMDENMPNMSGSQATHVIRQIEQETGAHVPIIALTANAMKGDRERFLKSGMDDYLSKPLQIPELNRVLQKYLT